MILDFSSAFSSDSQFTVELSEKSVIVYYRLELLLPAFAEPRCLSYTTTTLC